LLNEDKSDGKIFNIGNPFANLSIKQVSDLLVEKMKTRNLVTNVDIKITSSGEFYGSGYQDVSSRVPSIHNIGYNLAWAPHYTFSESLDNILDSLPNTAL
jgi:nucleoside-diphosphate-sugar epimerase